MLDQSGELLQRVRTDDTVRRGQWTALADISPALRTAMVLSEDKRFFAHSGVDWRAASAAAWANLWNTRTRGASTLTMQLAGLIDDDLAHLRGGRSFTQKFDQTLAALELERHWRKDQILEAYLNNVPFRGELVGIDALSQTLFGKAPNGLDAREAAVAAALVRGPNAKPAMIAQRACEVLRSMAPPDANASPDCAAIDLFTAGALQRHGFAASEGIAPHAALRALREVRTPGLSGAASAAPESIRTTLRAPLQRFARDALQRHLRELRGRNVEDGALVVLDNASGDVLAWVGSSGDLSAAREVDAVLALRQPGSTLKPFLYAEAIAEKRLTAASLLDDSPAQIGTASGLYIPQNYDRKFKGHVSVRTALASSLNVPAVRTLVMVTPRAFAAQLRALGLPLKEGGDYYGYSLALGSAEVSLLSLTNAYRALANGGRFSETRLLSAAPLNTPSQVLDAGAAFIVGDILADRNPRARTFGLDSVLGSRAWSAVKTGTSKDMRDNWAVGWSQRYTVGVWVGNASGAAMHDVSGTSGAAPVWAELMGYLNRPSPKPASAAPTAPAGVESQHIAFGPGPDGGTLEAERDEWFLRGTAQTLFAIDSIAVSARTAGVSGTNRLKNTDVRDAGAARIAAPADGTIVALDPDIPPRHQRLRFAAVGAAPGAEEQVQWRIDGKPIARGRQAEWLPWPGRHRVELVDGDGRMLDRIQLEVRGAGVVAASDRR